MVILALLWGLSITAQSSAGGGAALDAESLRPIPADAWTRAAAAHLLRRASFGGSPDEVDRLHAKGVDAAVEHLLHFEDIEYEPVAAAIPDAARSRVDFRRLRRLSEDERRRVLRDRRRLQRGTLEEVRLWWVERMLESPRPLEEVVTLMWHGHFTSSARKVRNAVFMFEQNELLRRGGLGDFRQLVLSVCRDRAMLRYLDGAQNSDEAANENFARELLELFTLGEGAYTERDVRAAALSFTGGRIGEDGFEFRVQDHDWNMKTFLGRRGNWKDHDIVAIIAAQDECARHVARLLLTTFVRPDPSDRLVRSLGRRIQREHYDLREVFDVLLRSEAFYASEARGSMIKSPVVLMVGTARQLEMDVRSIRALERAVAQMGQELFNPPSVKGWDGGPKWITTATLFQRYNSVTQLVTGYRDRSGGWVGRLMSDPSSRLTSSNQPAYDPLPLIESRYLETAEAIVDFYIEYLLATPLDAAKRDVLVSYLRGADNDFDIYSSDAAVRIRRTLVLLMCTPEYQLH